jgi:hypothetical protein
MRPGVRPDVSGRERSWGGTGSDLAVGEALLGCLGFRAESDGMTIGTVADVRYGPSTRWDHPTALAIRAGRESMRVMLVTADQVTDVLPDERVVVLGHPFVVSASETAAPLLPLAGVEAHALRRGSRRRRRRSGS